jgi:DNA-binding transcriptional MerR regulator
MNELAAHRTQKHPDAFRTIGEVSEELDVPHHVLRFWETRFTHIKPLKRAGGRRFYRPQDVHLLRAIRHYLYGEGYTIRGVQKLLKEQGINALVAGWRDNATFSIEEEDYESLSSSTQGDDVHLERPHQHSSVEEEEWLNIAPFETPVTAPTIPCEPSLVCATPEQAKSQYQDPWILDAGDRTLLTEALLELRACAQMLHKH